MMHCWLELNASALRHNFQNFKTLAGSANLAAVLKSNAYGHGLKETYGILKSEHPSWLAVAYLDEADLLRKEGFKGRILMVAPVLKEEFARAKQLDAEILLTHTELLQAWKSSAAKPKIHIKIDTGLTRQGFYHEEAGKLATELKDQASLVAGVCTHFANVEDVLEHEYASLQLKRFNEACLAFEKAGMKILRHSASSASTLILPESKLDMCRIGISLYGFWPSQTTRLSYLQLNAKVIDLKPVMTWKTKVFLTKDVKAGTYIGYGCTYRANHDMRVAVLPLGYNEGYPRTAANDKSYVLIRGQRCPLVGRISMNLMVVDISHCPGVLPEDEVVLMGRQGEEQVSAEQLAAWADTIHYELVTRLNPVIPRIVV